MAGAEGRGRFGATAAAGGVTAGAATAIAAAGAETAGGVTAAAATGATRPVPCPDAYSPHSAWLNDDQVTELRVIGVRDSTPASPSTSLAKPHSARLGPVSTNTRAPASYSVRSPVTNCTGDATWRPRISRISSSAPGPVG